MVEFLVRVRAPYLVRMILINRYGHDEDAGITCPCTMPIISF